MASITEHRIVLLVDDDVMIRNVLRRSLESAHFRVFSAADAQEALEVSRSFPDRIDVLIADVEMPGMDGVALAAQITSERRDTAVLFMSGGTERPIPENIPFISKPFSPAELVAKVAGILGQRTEDNPPPGSARPAR
jgi:two-component system OmpR family response regulator